MVDLSVMLPGARLKNPLVLASGIRGNNAELLIRAAREGAGAVTSKSCSLSPREGHANPTALVSGSVMLNAIGLSNPGVEAETHEIRKAVAQSGVPVIASVFAHSADDFALVAQKISLARPALIELDISCPNVSREGEMFSSSVAGAESVTRAVKAKVKSVPISVKLAPNVSNIGAIARAVQAAGADCITAINTMPALWIDAQARKPILHNQYGGLSGPALKPIALRCVYEIRQNCSLPIIGGGGITTGTDAAEMLMAGATAVSVGSAVYYRKNAFGEIKAELEQFMKAEHYSKISEIKLLEK